MRKMNPKLSSAFQMEDCLHFLNWREDKSNGFLCLSHARFWFPKKKTYTFGISWNLSKIVYHMVLDWSDIIYPFWGNILFIFGRHNSNMKIAAVQNIRNQISPIKGFYKVALLNRYAITKQWSKIIIGTLIEASTAGIKWLKSRRDRLISTERPCTSWIILSPFTMSMPMLRLMSFTWKENKTNNLDHMMLQNGTLCALPSQNKTLFKRIEIWPICIH